MTEKKVFDSNFHRWYVGGEGEVKLSESPFSPKNEVVGQTYNEILAEYRAYVGDSEAQLPQDIMEELRRLGKI